MKKSILPLFLCFPLLLLLLGGCVSTSVSTQPKAVLATGSQTEALQTYAWYQERPKAPAAYDKDYSATLDQHLRTAIEAELAAKGFKKATSANPDVLIAYDVSVSVPLEMDNRPYMEGFGYSYAYMAGYRYNYRHNALPGYRAVDLYKSGTLIIDLINPQTKELMWRGWAEGAISNFKANYNTVHREVERVLKTIRAR